MHVIFSVFTFTFAAAMKKLYFLLFSLFISLFAAAQLGTWQTQSFTFNFKNKKLNGFFEAQARANNLTKDFFYTEFKGGLNYKAFDNSAFLIGVGHYRTYQPEGNFKGPMTSNEMRVWEQAVLTNYLSRVKFEHRFRIEQRFFKDADYRNRFRYRANFFFPINKTKFEKGTWYINAHDEIFLNNKAPHFERNRIFIGAGYYLNKTLTIQPGLMNQYNYRANGTSDRKWFFQLSFLYNINVADDDEYIISVMD